ncbi:peptidylprolyl isomerase [Mesorhizobium sp. LHD-90]|uniref:peptidylprolyl isomerase n=1 Tax=Mesorhizobium sp. LHD-90 TaxID=3071414 RepID=UPI0027E1B0E9|nr:peptidylprolyl isomerase [Mesorhizobium sp. LHD-90]MDQ6432712.1 peptidylprolyl isomerase [Mesorhizobium sp. LHD-90]
MNFRSRRAKLASLGLAAVLLAAAPGAALSQEAAADAGKATPADPNKVVATVDGQPVTEADLSQAIQDLDQQFARLPEEQKRAAALSAVIEIRLLAAEAKAKGFDQSDEYKRRMAFLEQRALHGEVIEKEVAATITDEDIRKRYDTEIANTPPVNEVHARHILVKTKEEADAIVKQLDGGAKFEDIAKEKSSDPGSGAQGGDLGWFGPGQMVPEFEKAAFALEPGSYTKEPVQSQFGWHIIKVEDKRAKQPPAFDQVKEQFRSLLLREKYFALVKRLREAGKVDVADPELKKGVDAMEKAEQ